MTKPWPDSATEHELRSLRKHLASFDGITPEIRIRNVEGGQADARPFTLITHVTTRTDKTHSFGYTAATRCAVTVFGSEVEKIEDPNEEAWAYNDVINKALIEGTRRDGPDIKIFDFSSEPEVAVESYMTIDPATTVDTRQDEFGLWKVIADVRYTVERVFDYPTKPLITQIKRKVTITLP